MWIKICGITRTEDALAAMQANVSAIGFNCFPDSKRYIQSEQAANIAGLLRDAATAQPEQQLPEFIGVFVNATTDTILQTVRTIGLTGVQFHGDETPEQIHACMQQLPGIKCIRALRVSAGRVADCLAAVSALQRLIRPDAVLLDAFVPGQYGGTGQTIDPSVPAPGDWPRVPHWCLPEGSRRKTWPARSPPLLPGASILPAVLNPRLESRTPQKFTVLCSWQHAPLRVWVRIPGDLRSHVCRFPATPPFSIVFRPTVC